LPATAVGAAFAVFLLVLMTRLLYYSQFAGESETAIRCVSQQLNHLHTVAESLTEIVHELWMKRILFGCCFAVSVC